MLHVAGCTEIAAQFDVTLLSIEIRNGSALMRLAHFYSTYEITCITPCHIQVHAAQHSN